MEERSILFQGDEVCAILDGKKTQTRRVLQKQPLDIIPMNESDRWIGLMSRDPNQGTIFKCKYGVPGDVLWIKETFHIHQDNSITYKADMDSEGLFWSLRDDGCHHEYMVDKWSPSIHMPRRASRILLEVVNIRVERVQDITHSDVEAEGLDVVPKLPAFVPPSACTEEKLDAIANKIAREMVYKPLWDSINAQPKPVKKGGRIISYVSYPWEDVQETREHRGLPWYVYGNSWVWCISFTRVENEKK